jgi:chromosome segregation ATPase
LVCDDIKAAQQQILSLDRQKSALQEEIESLDSEIDQLKQPVDASHGPTITAESSESRASGFFEFLGVLEREEAGLRGEIQSYKEVQRDFSHRRAQLQNKARKIEALLSKSRSQLEIEANHIRDSKSLLKELRIASDAKRTELEAVSGLRDELKAEGAVLSEQAKHYDDSELSGLRNRERDRANDLLKQRKKLLHRQKELERTYQSYEKTAAQSTAKRTQDDSVTAWLAPRSLYTTKLRKAKEDLAQICKEIAGVARAEVGLRGRFARVLGDGEDSDGQFARHLVQREIRAMQRRIDGDKEVALQLEIEKTFAQELETEKLMLDQSLEIFEEHRRSQMAALNEELKEGGSSGYLEMLESELAQLKALVASSEGTARVSDDVWPATSH